MCGHLPEIQSHIYKSYKTATSGFVDIYTQNQAIGNSGNGNLKWKQK